MQKHPTEQLYDQKRELLEKTQALEARLRELQTTKSSRAVRIAELSREADRLAAIFRPLFQQSQVAYEAGDGALAKELSVQGREIEAQCKALNAQVSALHNEPNDVRDEITRIKQETAALNDKIKRYDRLRPIAMDGFEQAQGVSAQMVAEELSVLPPRLLRHIKRVTYVHERRPNFELGRTASKEHNPDQTTIFLFQYPFDLEVAGLDMASLQEEYRRTILHEIGHVFFDWVMNLKQRLSWGDRYNDTLSKGDQFINKDARRGKRDDFVECFWMYRHDPGALREYDEGRYTDIDTAYKEVSQ